jgi:hypothetical protein
MIAKFEEQEDLVPHLDDLSRRVHYAFNTQQIRAAEVQVLAVVILLIHFISSFICVTILCMSVNIIVTMASKCGNPNSLSKLLYR